MLATGFVLTTDERGCVLQRVGKEEKIIKIMGFSIIAVDVYIYIGTNNNVTSTVPNNCIVINI